MSAVESNGQDPTMGINNFGDVKILGVTETVCRNLLLLLFGRPGFYPSEPELGIDISQYFYSFDSIDPTDIEAKIEYQCSKLVPEISSLDFHVYMTTYKNQGMLVIQFPIIRKNERFGMALGITQNSRGEFMYRFVEDKNQLI